MGSLDKKNDILDNLKIVCKKINSNSKKLILLNQTHSNKFHFIRNTKQFKSKKLRGDALITNKKKVILGILTADCVPILVFDPDKKVIAAIHAGWKGAYKDIVKKVIKFFIKKGSKPKNLIAAIGPSITDKSYEVKKKFKQKFINKNKQNKVFFKIRKNKTYFGLNKYIYSELKKLGVKKLEIINKNTFNSKNNYFSARRSISNGDNDYGRNISIIMIN
jgi:polyphenol oxidase